MTVVVDFGPNSGLLVRLFRQPCRPEEPLLLPYDISRALVRPEAPPTPAGAALPGLNGRAVRFLSHVETVRWGKRLMAAVIVLFAATVAAGYGVPAYAQVTAVAPRPVLQGFTVSPAVVAPPVAVRDTFDVTVPPPLVWPVDPASAIASPFGPRVSPCAGCSSAHEGVDFDAGYGAQVHAIAAGTVVETDNPNWSALGVHAAIEHLIDGQVVVSAYGHLQTGSMPLHVGDTVYPGEVIGLVGSTGASTGPHLHFEIRLGGSQPTDPVPWMHARLG